jgi:hypothetical protein
VGIAEWSLLSEWFLKKLGSVVILLEWISGVGIVEWRLLGEWVTKRIDG